MSGAAVIAATAAVVGTAYTIYSTEKAEKKQEEALAQQAEATKAASDVEAENQKRAASSALATQRARLAQGGVVLDEAGSTGMKLSEDIQSDLTRNLTTLGTQTGYQLANISSQAGMIKTGESAAISSGLNLAGTLAGSYTQYKTAQTNQALLARALQTTPTTTTTAPTIGSTTYSGGLGIDITLQ